MMLLEENGILPLTLVLTVETIVNYTIASMDTPVEKGTRDYQQIQIHL